MWWKLDLYFSLDKISEDGIPYCIVYGKSKIVQFFHLCNLWRFVWMWLSFPAYIRSGLFNAGWINDQVFERMAPSFGMKKKRWRFELKDLLGG